MKAFGKYDGFYYTFEKDVFSKREIKEVDALGKIFSLDATKIYDRTGFDAAIKPPLLEAQLAFRKLERGILEKNNLSAFMGERWPMICWLS